MTVYVDDMHLTGLGKYRRMKMSHMIADTTEELLQMADAIGVARKWLQYPNHAKEHFDVCLSAREKAIKRGAVPLTMRELAKKVYDRAKQKARHANENAKSQGGSHSEHRI
jgi:hypothetical protein